MNRCIEARVHAYGDQCHTNSFEDSTQVFILRIWLERREVEYAVPVWRGVIEHLPGGEQRYFKNLDEIIIFAIPYLEDIGIRPGLFWRVEQWLNHLRFVLNKQKR